MCMYAISPSVSNCYRSHLIFLYKMGLETLESENFFHVISSPCIFVYFRGKYRLLKLIYDNRLNVTTLHYARHL